MQIMHPSFGPYMPVWHAI